MSHTLFQKLATVCLATCLGAALVAGGCSKLTLPRLVFEEETPQGPSVPLRVRVDLDPLLQQAAFPYTDACSAPQALPVGKRLSQLLLNDTRKVFQEVIDRDEPSLGIVADAVLQFTVEEQNYDLLIPGLVADAEFPAKATLRVRAVLQEADNGQEIFSTSVVGTGKWRVTTDPDGRDCELGGIGIPVDEALEDLSEQLVDSLRNSGQIQAAAVRLLAKRQVLARTAPQPTIQRSVPLVGGAPPIPGGISFRVLLEDGNRNRILEGGELVTMTVEVTNPGPGIAQGIMVALSGTPALVKHFNAPLSLGPLQAGERRQVTLTATLPSGIAEQQSELIVQLIGPNGLVPPTPKRFIAWVRPSGFVDGGVEVLSVDVDHIPAKARGFERKNRFAVVVGIGTYRGEDSPSLAYAKRDAEVVAQYLQAVAGVPESNIRVLTDEFAVLSDLRDVFERWLPQQVVADSVVMIYVVGKGIARTKTGEVFLLPFEARSASRYRVYPLSHLLKTVGRLPGKAILFFDLSFPNRGARPPRLAWMAPKANRKKAILIASSNVATPSVQFDRGQHGLFTYFWLKGLGGEADDNRNGIVGVTELYGYLKDRLPDATRVEGQQARSPVMVPKARGRIGLGAFPLGKVTHTVRRTRGSSSQ